MSQFYLDVTTIPGHTINTLSAQGGAHTPPDLTNNFDFTGAGAITFATISNGHMTAAVKTDGTTITINGSDQLAVIGSAFIQKLIPNSGTSPVIPDASGQVTLIGTGSITTVGSLNTETIQLSGLSNHNVLVGSGTPTITNVPPLTNGWVLTSNGAGADPSFQSITAAGAITTITGNSGGAEVPSGGNFNILGTGSVTVVGSANTETIQLTGLTSHAVLVGAGTATITKVGPTATAGQVLQSAGAAADPAFSTATYPLTTTVSQILYSSATNTVSGLATANDGVLVTSNTGVPSILAGPGTTGQVLQANAAAAPSFSTASYPSTTTVSQILYSSSTNVVAGLATANQAVLTTGATGIPVLTALATNGQLIIGSTAGVPAAATLTAGAGITITNGANSITVAAIGSGFTWTDNSGSFTAAVDNGYFITAASTPTLPAAPVEGDSVAFVVDTASTCTITANTGQKIRIGSALSAAAGTCASNARGDSIELVYRSSGTTWFSLGSPEGTWTVT